MTGGLLFTWLLRRVTRTVWHSCFTSAGWSLGQWTDGASLLSPRPRDLVTRISPTSSSCGHRGTVTPWHVSLARSSCRRSSRLRNRTWCLLFIGFQDNFNAFIHRNYGFQMHTIKAFYCLYSKLCSYSPWMCDVPNNHYSVLSTAHTLTCPRDMHISPVMHNIITLRTLLAAYLGHVIRGLSKGEWI